MTKRKSTYDELLTALENVRVEVRAGQREIEHNEDFGLFDAAELLRGIDGIARNAIAKAKGAA